MFLGENECGNISPITKMNDVYSCFPSCSTHMLRGLWQCAKEYEKLHKSVTLFSVILNVLLLNTYL